MKRQARRQAGFFSRVNRRTVLALVIACLLCAGEALASGGGKPATKLVNVADTRGLESGISLWVGNAYNSGFWTYGLIVVVTMAGMGAVLGFTFDKLIGLFGIKFGKLEHHE